MAPQPRRRSSRKRDELLEHEGVERSTCSTHVLLCAEQPVVSSNIQRRSQEAQLRLTSVMRNASPLLIRLSQRKAETPEEEPASKTVGRTALVEYERYAVLAGAGGHRVANKSTKAEKGTSANELLIEEGPRPAAALPPLLRCGVATRHSQRFLGWYAKSCRCDVPRRRAKAANVMCVAEQRFLCFQPRCGCREPACRPRGSPTSLCTRCIEQEAKIFTYGGLLEDRVTRPGVPRRVRRLQENEFGWVESRAGRCGWSR